MTSMPRPGGAPLCPECGRPVPAPGLKLCPHCGYPLMLDRPAQVEEVQHKILHKPTGPGDGIPSRTSQMQRPVMPPYAGPPRVMPGYPPPAIPSPQFQPPPRAQAFGPHCPACHHANPPARKRCDPARWMPDPPPVYLPPPRRNWWRIALAIGIPLTVMGGVWALAAFL
jgi:hypothetical protein